MNMSSPGIRPQNNKPATGPSGKQDSQRELHVISAVGVARAATPSVAMPRAKTELSELLAGDHVLCARRRVSANAMRQNAEARSGADAEPQAAQTVDADLACVIDAWPGLSEDVRAAVLALIREPSGEA